MTITIEIDSLLIEEELQDEGYLTSEIGAEEKRIKGMEIASRLMISGVREYDKRATFTVSEWMN